MAKALAALAVGAAALATSGGVLGAGGSTRAGTPQISIVACHDVVKAPLSGGSFYWKCMGPFSLGIPHTTTKMAFLVENRGLPKNGSFTLNFVDNKSGAPLTSPIKFGPTKFDPGLWRLGFTGPFPVMTLRIEASVNGKTLPGTSLFRFL